MKIVSRKGGYAHTMYEVELSPEEFKLSDRVLITMADNYECTMTAERAAEIDGPGRAPGVCHFGGYVNRRPEKGEATIKVYTD